MRPHPIIIFLTTILSAAIVYLFVFTYDIFQYGDNCGYMTLGIAIAQGDGFTDPAVGSSPHFLWWPHGFPLFIALFIIIFGSNWILLKILLLAFLYISIALFAFLLYKRSIPYKIILMVLLTICFSSTIHLLSSYLYSEIFFLSCTLLFFYLWDRWRRNLNYLTFIFLSLFCVFICSVRLIGISLFISFIFTCILDKRFIQIGTRRFGKVCIILPLVLLLVYMIISIKVPNLQVESLRAAVGLNAHLPSKIQSSLHSNPISDDILLFSFTKKIIHFLRSYSITLIPQSLIRGLYDLTTMNKLKALCMLCVTGTIVLGWVITYRKHKLINIYVLVYLLILFVHGPKYLRLLIPIVPIFHFYFISILLYGATRIKRIQSIAMICVYGIWALLLIDNMYISFVDARRSMPSQFGDVAYQKCINWIIKNSKREEPVLSQIHSFLYLKRGGICLPYNFPQTAQEFVSYCKEFGVVYAIVSPYYQRSRYTYMDCVRDAINTYPQYFKIIYHEGGSFVVKCININK